MAAWFSKFKNICEMVGKRHSIQLNVGRTRLEYFHGFNRESVFNELIFLLLITP